jgi:hypothetical protein
MRRTSIAPALLAAVALQLGPPHRVTKVNDAYPMLSPDGSRLVFESDRAGNLDIYTMKPDGTDLVRLTKTGRVSLLVSGDRTRDGDLSELRWLVSLIWRF